MDEIVRALLSVRTEVIDADLSKYFDTIPHRQILRRVAQRVSDGWESGTETDNCGLFNSATLVRLFYPRLGTKETGPARMARIAVRAWKGK